MFEYVLTSEVKSGTVDTTGFCDDFKDVKQETLLQTPECIHRRSTYPNGFVIEVEQYSNKVIIRTNWELFDNGNGTFSVIQP